MNPIKKILRQIFSIKKEKVLLENKPIVEQVEVKTESIKEDCITFGRFRIVKRYDYCDFITSSNRIIIYWVLDKVEIVEKFHNFMKINENRAIAIDNTNGDYYLVDENLNKISNVKYTGICIMDIKNDIYRVSIKKCIKGELVNYFNLIDNNSNLLLNKWYKYIHSTKIDKIYHLYPYDDTYCYLSKIDHIILEELVGYDYGKNNTNYLSLRTVDNTFILFDVEKEEKVSDWYSVLNYTRLSKNKCYLAKKGELYNILTPEHKPILPKGRKEIKTIEGLNCFYYQSQSSIIAYNYLGECIEDNNLFDFINNKYKISSQVKDDLFMIQLEDEFNFINAKTLKLQLKQNADYIDDVGNYIIGNKQGNIFN